jgi:ABC-2 type transport system permease protein
VGSRVKSQLQYRASFALELASNFFGSTVELACLLVVFGHVRTLGGWYAAEVLLLFGTTTVSFGVAQLVGGSFDHFAGVIRSGRFDTLLVRPVSDFLQVMSLEFELRRLGHLVHGVAVLVGALWWRGVPLAPWQWTVLAGSLVCGVLFYLSLFMVQATSCFWTVESLEVFNILTHGGNELLSHPLDIFGRWIQRIFIYLIPMAFINYLPIGMLLGKGGLVAMLPRWIGWLAPAVGVAVFLVARAVWAFGVRHYQSTGS